MFSHLELQCVLNPLSDIDLSRFIWCLYHDLIVTLMLGKDAWNQHSMTTVGGLSPRQQFVEGQLRIHGSDDVVATEMFEHLNVVS